MQKQLTAQAKAAGCAAKLPQEFLSAALRNIPRVPHPDLLIGFENSDDAGIFRLSPDLALVQTLDFFTPVVDDPFTFGAVAAANALSDVWAMGGEPLTALSILCYPARGDAETLAEILRGGASKIAEAGCVLLGGHSVADDDIKFGYSITGRVHPDKFRANSHARPGDILLLTKPLGVGVITTALKRGFAAPEHIAAAEASMLKLNKDAAAAMSGLDIHGVTDVTGFGLMGHGREMAEASKVTLHINVAAIPLLNGAREAVAADALSGGLYNNRKFNEPRVQRGANIPDDLYTLLFDPQTSGGLLISLPSLEVDKYLARYPAAVIGEVSSQEESAICLH